LQGRVLIADGEGEVRENLRQLLEDEGYSVVCVESSKEALKELESSRFDIILTDVQMSGIGSTGVLKRLQQLTHSDAVTIILTGQATVDSAIESMKLGAFDYILKPFNPDELVETVKKAHNFVLLQRENISLKEAMSLYKLSEISISSLNIDTIIDAVLRTLRDETKADTICLKLEGNNSNSSLEAKDGCFSDYCSDGCIFDKKKLFPYTRRGEVVVLNQEEVIQTAAKNHKLTAESIKSAIIIPLKSAARNFGYISIPSFDKVFSEGERKVVTIIASQAIAALENVYLHNNIQKSFREVIQGLVYALEAKEKYTAGHSIRVAYYTKTFTENLKLTPKERDDLFQAALLHDIGKIGIRIDSLSKPGSLTAEEYEIFKVHPKLGKKILEPISFLSNIIPYIYHHHERFDGNGYPEKLKGDNIPYGARILTITDSYDVMTSDRPYRKRLKDNEIIKELENCSGTQFDPELVKIFIDIRKHSKEFEFIRSDEFFKNIGKMYTYTTNLFNPDFKLFVNEKM